MPPVPMVTTQPGKNQAETHEGEFSISPNLVEQMFDNLPLEYSLVLGLAEERQES